MKGKLFALLVLLPLLGAAQARTDISLNGQWTFAPDPVNVGESNRWFAEDFAAGKFDRVNVPHCFSVDPRYMFYTGTAWYFKKFVADEPAGSRVFIKFDAVFYRSSVWLNGELIGQHEGGYTPFELDITEKVKKENVLAVEVNNAWDTTTIPGAKTKVSFESPNAAQFFPWINYGGITRPVHLITRPSLYIENMKIVAEPDLKKGNASIHISAYIRNSGPAALKPVVSAFVYDHGKKTDARFKSVSSQIRSGSAFRAELIATISAGEVKLWNQDEPNLYLAELIAGDDTLTASFGIRKLEIKGTSLLLNGEPIRMGGCNRPLDYPGYGSMDPKPVLDQDLTLIKEGCMELSRINHYPLTEYQLDWADAHGLLIIEEAGNWQMTPKQMSDTLMRGKFRSQMREMVERDWNHPSLIAYSVGNEFQSQTEEGKSWVRDMGAFVKSMDPSRMITFASMMVRQDIVKSPEDEASRYVDFISANMYGNFLKNLQHIHSVYPDKPVFVSEFGIRTDNVKTEADRISYLKNAMHDFRQCDFLIGASVWTFNDYLSRFPGTNPNGYRPWGLVGPHRELRGMYAAWQEEFSPATIEPVKRAGEMVTIRVRARKDFPSYTLRGYQIRYNNQIIPLHTLKPGEEQELILRSPASELEVELVKPGSFVILKKRMKGI
jgi:beta-glucuronidase